MATYHTRSSSLPNNFRFGDLAIVDGLQAIAVARPDGNPPFYLTPGGEQQPGSGGGGQAFVYQQSQPSGLWIVNHNLGYFPSVEVFDIAGNVITSGVSILNASVNQVRVVSNPAVNGSIRCL